MESPQYTSLAQAAWQSGWSAAHNILVMRLDNIGDVLMTSPALRSIKENLPQSTLTLLASPSGAQAAPLLPWVDQVLPYRAPWQALGKLGSDPHWEWELIQTLRDHQFDAAIILTSFSQTPHPAGFLCYLAGIPLRLGASKEWGGAVLTTEARSTPDTVHQVERNLQLIEAVGFQVYDRHLCIQIPEVDRHRAFQKRVQHQLSQPYILLNPWASCPARTYDLERFAFAGRRLAEITGYKVVVTGIEKDRDRSAVLFEILATHAVDLMGRTTLPELAALVADAALLLSSNTSTMHLADATHTPSVISFSGTDYESQWQPRQTSARLLRQATECSPCYGFTCPYELGCLDIPIDTVVAAGLEQLALPPTTLDNP